MMKNALDKVRDAMRVAYTQGKETGAAAALAHAESELYAAVQSEQVCRQERELQVYNCEQSINDLWFQAQIFLDEAGE